MTWEINPAKVVRIPANAFDEFGQYLLILSKHGSSCFSRYPSLGFFHYSLPLINSFILLSYVWSFLPMRFTLVFDSSNMVIIAIHVYCTYAYLYWSAMHIGPAYEFCCSYGNCESDYKYGLPRKVMLFDREKMERKTR